MSAEEMRPLFRQYLPVVFSSGFHLDAGYAFSETERRELASLGERLRERYTLSLGIFHRDEHGDEHGDAFVGWHVGNQVEAGRFYMTNTGILQEHRGRGLYTALLPVVLNLLEQEGFQTVYSRHNLTNNAVIVPKLKAGFVISGFEVDDRFGTLVQLSYFFNPLRRKVIDVRVGQRAPVRGG